MTGITPNPRLARIVNAQRTRATLVRALYRHFTAAELAELFDTMAETSATRTDLANALGLALAEAEAQDERAKDAAQITGPGVR